MSDQMPTFSNRRPGTVWALMVFLCIQALGAIGGGAGLVQDPVENIGMPLSMLEGSPFSDFLVPGLILLIVVGLPPLAAVYGLAGRRRWGWWLAIVAGVGLLIWIITEVALLGYLPGTGIGLQIGMGLLGVLILVMALVRPTRRYLIPGGSRGV